MKKVISYSLWGDDPKYTHGAIRNAELASIIYPGWTCRFYINHIPESIFRQLKSLNAEIKQETGTADWRGMFWRFQSSYDPEVDISIFRDCDSRLNKREKAAVEDWIESDKTFHIMRDHPFHQYPILGGMWGYKKNSKYDMESLFKQFLPTDNYGTDYTFFQQILYPVIAEDKMVHDEFFDKKSFPTKRIGQEFVGEVYDENDVRHPEHYRYI